MDDDDEQSIGESSGGELQMNESFQRVNQIDNGASHCTTDDLDSCDTIDYIKKKKFVVAKKGVHVTADAHAQRHIPVITSDE